MEAHHQLAELFLSYSCVFRAAMALRGCEARDSSYRRKRGCRVVFTFSANLHSTIWGTVQSAKSHRKVGGGITAAKEENAESRRKAGGIITAAKRKSAESRRKVGGGITAAKRKSAESRRKVGDGITAVKCKSAKSRRKVGGGITAAKCKIAESSRNLPADVHKEPACRRRFFNLRRQ